MAPFSGTGRLGEQLMARIGLPRVVALVVILLLNNGRLLNYSMHLPDPDRSMAGTTPSEVGKTDMGTRSPPPSNFSKYGEATEEQLETLDLVPTSGRWKGVNWAEVKESMGGNKQKIVCTLRDVNHAKFRLPNSVFFPSSWLPQGSEDIQSQDSRRHEYKVIVRSHNSQEGVGAEYLAYAVARELGLHQIPTQSLIPQPRDNGKSSHGIINVQSMLDDVRLTFLDNWTNCIPRAGEAASMNDAGSNDQLLSSALLQTTNAIMIPGNNSDTSQLLSIQPVQTDPHAVWRLCFRNFSLPYIDWLRWCAGEVGGPATVARRSCRQTEIAQLLEMALFDAIIYNADRLHANSYRSNNVHWIWPSEFATSSNAGREAVAPKLNPDGTLQLVWIDQGHHTLKNARQRAGPNRSRTGLMMEFFYDYCVFPGRLLKKVFGADDAKDGQIPLTARVLERITPKIRFLEEQHRRLLRGQYAEERLQNFTRMNREWTAERLEVVDRQIAVLGQVVARCASRHEPPGMVDVMDYDPSIFS